MHTYIHTDAPSNSFGNNLAPPKCRMLVVASGLRVASWIPSVSLVSLVTLVVVYMSPCALVVVMNSITTTHSSSAIDGTFATPPTVLHFIVNYN